MKLEFTHQTQFQIIVVKCPVCAERVHIYVGPQEARGSHVKSDCGHFKFTIGDHDSLEISFVSKMPV